MPELPEVETVRRSLLPLQGQTLEKTVVKDGRLRYKVTQRLTSLVIGENLEEISRHGKYLVLRFPSDALVFHLGMTGRLLIGQKQRSPYLKIQLGFNRDTLDFIDVRRFAFVLSGEAGKNALPSGGDALANLDALYLTQRICASRAPVKSILLDQGIIAGLGNIYVSEILFLAKIHPAKRGIELSGEDVGRILKATPKVLRKAIKSKGSSISDFVFALPGEKEYATGNYQKKFLVYSREGAACKVCRAKIGKIVQSGRSSFFCPRCQRR